MLGLYSTFLQPIVDCRWINQAKTQRLTPPLIAAGAAGDAVVEVVGVDVVDPSMPYWTIASSKVCIEMSVVFGKTQSDLNNVQKLEIEALRRFAADESLALHPCK